LIEEGERGKEERQKERAEHRLGKSGSSSELKYPSPAHPPSIPQVKARATRKITATCVTIVVLDTPLDAHWMQPTGAGASGPASFQSRTAYHSSSFSSSSTAPPSPDCSAAHRRATTNTANGAQTRHTRAPRDPKCAPQIGNG
jgi:hypothetical protein